MEQLELGGIRGRSGGNEEKGMRMEGEREGKEGEKGKERRGRRK